MRVHTKLTIAFTILMKISSPIKLKYKKMLIGEKKTMRKIRG
jgi:hypothetical protein